MSPGCRLGIRATLMRLVRRGANSVVVSKPKPQGLAHAHQCPHFLPRAPLSTRLIAVGAGVHQLAEESVVRSLCGRPLAPFPHRALGKEVILSAYI